MRIVLSYLVVINTLGFYMMWSDKKKAKRGVWRIPERNFFLVSVLGGSLGCWLGMQAFRHKTQHIKFTVGIPGVLLLQLAVALYVWQL